MEESCQLHEPAALPHGTQFIGGWVGRRAGLDVLHAPAALTPQFLWVGMLINVISAFSASWRLVTDAVEGSRSRTCNCSQVRTATRTVTAPTAPLPPTKNFRIRLPLLCGSRRTRRGETPGHFLWFISTYREQIGTVWGGGGGVGNHITQFIASGMLKAASHFTSSCLYHRRNSLGLNRNLHSFSKSLYRALFS
jgi:hypothetical protein